MHPLSPTFPHINNANGSGPKFCPYSERKKERTQEGGRKEKRQKRKEKRKVKSSQVLGEISTRQEQTSSLKESAKIT